MVQLRTRPVLCLASLGIVAAAPCRKTPPMCTCIAPCCRRGADGCGADEAAAVPGRRLCGPIACAGQLGAAQLGAGQLGAELEPVGSGGWAAEQAALGCVQGQSCLPHGLLPPIALHKLSDCLPCPAVCGGHAGAQDGAAPGERGRRPCSRCLLSFTACMLEPEHNVQPLPLQRLSILSICQDLSVQVNLCVDTNSAGG